jgi:glycosyltransferase involved in cell wall biosynthesis
MRIGINAIGFAPGKMGGVETYLRALVQQLQAIDKENGYTLLCDEWNAAELALPNANFDSKVCTYPRKTMRKLVRDILWKGARIDVLRAKPRYQQLDVVHHPFTTMKPEWGRLPSVLTFWDMQHEFYPEFFSQRELEKRNRTYRPSVATATRIIVSSLFTRDCLVERYGVSPEKIDVVYTGVSPECRRVSDAKMLASVAERHGLSRPFLYYPAATWPHKNHKTLLDAFNILVRRQGFDGDLVLTGIAMQSSDEIAAKIKELGLDGRVKVLGYLKREELPCLFSMARMMVFPSLFEGFGIPIVEAMACGCPVAGANATSLPEVIGDAGALFDPSNAGELAELLWSLWQDEARLSAMREQGYKRVRLFDWRLTAEQTLAVYRRAAA